MEDLVLSKRREMLQKTPPLSELLADASGVLECPVPVPTEASLAR